MSGKRFIEKNIEKIEDLCYNIKEEISIYEASLSGGNFYDGWMKNEKSAMISCNDGFRPVSFLLEACD